MRKFYALIFFMENKFMKFAFYGLSFVLLIPLLFLVITALTSFDVSMVIHVLSTTFIPQVINTLSLLGGTAIVSLCLSVPLAYFYSNYEFKYKQPLSIIMTFPLAIPTFLLATIYANTLSIMITNIYGFILLAALSMYPYIYLSAKNIMIQQSQIYNDIALVHGLNSWQRFIKILLPASYPAIISGLFLVIMEAASDYGTTVILGVPTLTTGIYMQWFYYFNPVVASQISFMIIGFFFILSYIYQNKKFMVNNPAENYVHKTLMTPSFFLKCIIYGFSLLILTAGFIYPVSVMGYWAYLSWGNLILTTLIHDVSNTVFLALSTMVISLCITLLMIFVKRYYKMSYADIFLLSWLRLVYGLPGIVIGIAVLSIIAFWYHIPILKIFFDSAWILVFAYCIKYYALMYINCDNAMQQISPKYDDVLSVHGKNNYMSFLFLMPTMGQSILVGGLLILIDVFRELTLVLMVQPKNFSTIAMHIYDYNQLELFYLMGAWGLILIIIMVVLVYFLNKYLRSDNVMC